MFLASGSSPGPPRVVGGTSGEQISVQLSHPVKKKKTKNKNLGGLMYRKLTDRTDIWINMEEAGIPYSSA